MKSLIQYILEATNDNLQTFAIDFEYFKEYAERNKILDGDIIYVGNKRKNIYITLSEVEQLYDYAKEYNKSCPIVVSYKRKPGHFVFRRWVASLNDMFSNIDLLSDKGAPYDGLHNTSLKEDGKWFPNAEDYESIIAFAYNKKHDLFKTDPDNILYVTGQEPVSDSKAEQLMSFYVANVDIIDAIVDMLPDNCGRMKKLYNTDKVTSEWIELGHYKEDNAKPSIVPKTDIICEKHRISVKEAGGSQLMSGYEQESRATMTWAAKQIGDKQLIDKVESLFSVPWLRNINSAKEENERNEAKSHNKELTATIKELWKNKQFKHLVIKEALTGAVKFGDGDKTADCVFVWDEVNPHNSKLYTIDEYIKHIEDDSTVIIALKTAATTSTAFRILTK